MTTRPETSMRRAGPTEDVIVTELDGAGRRQRPDTVAGEEPLEIRVGAPGADPRPVAVTMRTPGNDFELAVGFLITEGLVSGQDGVRSVKYCELPAGDPQQYNVVTVTTRHPLRMSEGRRATTVSASCGICGTATLELLRDRCPTVPDGARMSRGVLVSLPERLRARQRVFDRTGGLHAAGLFDVTGELEAAREDIGRHNAVDKLVGWAALSGSLPLSSGVLVVSGRVSFEIVQKAAVAGIPTLVAVSAPSSLAVATAQALGMTLAGFVRGDRANLYSAPWRIEGTTP